MMTSAAAATCTYQRLEVDASRRQSKVSGPTCAMHVAAHARTRLRCSSGRWQYRWGMQGNIFAGRFIRMSLVPPCLRTGANFGNSAWFAGIYRCAQLGLLGDTLYRLTDSGPDNDAKAVHALHVQLVSQGVVQKLVWIRLRPKHSHNLADRLNSMVKEQIWPQRGTGGGCMAPWDLDDIIQKALKSQQGRLEFGWHWQNLDWTQMYEGHYHKDFAGFGSERYWVYEFDESLPQHHYVRATYRRNLLQPEANSRDPEFLPCGPTADGRLVTLPQGQLIMKTLPDVLLSPPIEPWKPAEPDEAEGITKRDSWHKVMRDIREHTAKSFPALQQEQWAAIDSFHDTYRTSDALPPSLPISITSQGASRAWVMQHGTPIDWKGAWSSLTLRYPRCVCVRVVSTCTLAIHLAFILSGCVFLIVSCCEWLWQASRAATHMPTNGSHGGCYGTDGGAGSGTGRG